MARSKRQIESRVGTSFRLPKDLHARLLKEADARDVSASFFVERALTMYLDKLIPVDQFIQTKENK